MTDYEDIEYERLKEEFVRQATPLFQQAIWSGVRFGLLAGVMLASLVWAVAIYLWRSFT